jgi:hypothetical protein
MIKKITIFIAVAAVLGLIAYLVFKSNSPTGTPVESIPENTNAESTTTPVMVQYRIKEITSEGEFNDALYFTKEEWAKLTKEELAAMVKKRVDNWVNMVKNPPKSAGPTQEELKIQAEELQRQLDEVNAQLKK